MYEDWTYSWYVTDVNGWEDEDQIRLTVNPEHIHWDDYGMHSRTFPTANMYTPWFTALSSDDTDYVTLTDPNIIELYVPYTTLQTFGPGIVNVGLQYIRTDTDRRRTVWYGRLPLLDTGGV
jgi:hypothetical protein